MGHTFKDLPTSRKNREDTLDSRKNKKVKRINRSRIKQKLRHDTQSIDDYYDDRDYIEYDDWADDDDYR